MSNKKNLGPADLRALAARKRVTKTQIAQALGLSVDYITRLMNGTRKSVARREAIREYLLGNREQGSGNRDQGSGIGEQRGLVEIPEFHAALGLKVRTA